LGIRINEMSGILKKIKRRQKVRCKKMFFFSFFLVVIFIQPYLAGAQTGGPQETLNQYISDLQKNPNEFALREKIIKLVQGMKPQPSVPEEVERYLARGRAAFKGAAQPKDFEDAVNEFKKALLIAPWVAEGYYNLGIVQDKAGQYQNAIHNLKLYLLAAPNATDVKEVKSLIFEIEYRQEKAQKEIVTKKKEEEAKFDFNGVWTEAPLSDRSCWRYKFIVSGRQLTITGECVGTHSTFVWGTGTVEGRNFEGINPGSWFAGGGSIPPERFKGSLSEDNRTITMSRIIDPEVAKTAESRKVGKIFIQHLGRQEWKTCTWTHASQ